MEDSFVFMITVFYYYYYYLLLALLLLFFLRIMASSARFLSISILSSFRFASASSEALDEPESLLSFCSEMSLCFAAASFASLSFSRAASALAFKSAIFSSFRRASCSAPAVFSDEESTVAAVTLSYSSSSSAAFELVILEALLYDL